MVLGAHLALPTAHSNEVRACTFSFTELGKDHFFGAARRVHNNRCGPNPSKQTHKERIVALLSLCGGLILPQNKTKDAFVE